MLMWRVLLNQHKNKMHPKKPNSGCKSNMNNAVLHQTAHKLAHKIMGYP